MIPQETIDNFRYRLQTKMAENALAIERRRKDYGFDTELQSMVMNNYELLTVSRIFGSGYYTYTDREIEQMIAHYTAHEGLVEYNGPLNFWEPIEIVSESSGSGDVTQAELEAVRAQSVIRDQNLQLEINNQQEEIDALKHEDVREYLDNINTTIEANITLQYMPVGNIQWSAQGFAAMQERDFTVNGAVLTWDPDNAGFHILPGEKNLISYKRKL